MSTQTPRREPRRPWAVHSRGEIHADFRSESSAYDYVGELAGLGHGAEVWHWEVGRWQLFERIPASPSDTKASDR